MRTFDKFFITFCIFYHVSIIRLVFLRLRDIMARLRPCD